MIAMIRAMCGGPLTRTRIVEGNIRKKILLTGGTGFLGSYLLLYLLRNSDSVVYCLARKKNNVSGAERLGKKLDDMLAGPLSADPRFAIDFKREWKRVVVFEGDVKYQHLGLSSQDYAKLRTDEVWHVAADIDFATHRQKQIFETNVQGTRHVLEFIRDRDLPLLNYVSTAYVCGQRAGRILDEEVDEKYPANNVYEESKRIAEREILGAHRGDSLRFRIFRPSVIVGHSQTLEIDSSSGLYSYLAVLLRLKDNIESRMPEYFHHNPLRLLFDDEITLNLICVDQVVQTMCQIAARELTMNQILHIVNPYPITLSKYMRTLPPILGITVSNEVNEERLNPVDAMLNAQTNIYGSYLKNDKRFDFDKMIRFSGAPKERFRINDATQEELTRRVYTHYMNDQRTRRKRLRSVTKRLELQIMSRAGMELLRYYAGGCGRKTLLILNAYGQSLAFWDWMISYLAEKYRVLIWQFRGTKSQSGGISRVYPIHEHVSDMAAILDTEEVESCDLIGWCTGPKMAFEFCGQHPNRTSSIISLSGCFKDWAGSEALYTEYERYMESLCRMVEENPGIAGGLTEVLKGVLTGKLELGSKPVTQSSDHETTVKGVLKLISNNIKPLVIEPFLTEESMISYARQLLSFWGHDVTAALRGTEVPTLFVSGEMDNIAASRMSRGAAALVRNAIYVEIKGGSHYMQYDNHHLLSEILDKFLSDPTEFDFSHGLVTLERSLATSVDGVLVS
jgi:thioester reductase-like protein/pimeloyl-ACP methyl ester carboxylesterase